VDPAHRGGAQNGATVPALQELAVEAVDGRRRQLLEPQMTERRHQVAADVHLVGGVSGRPDRCPSGWEPCLSQESGDDDLGRLGTWHEDLLLLAAARAAGHAGIRRRLGVLFRLDGGASSPSGAATTMYEGDSGHVHRNLRHSPTGPISETVYFGEHLR
jgi:hypothetical protein